MYYQQVRRFHGYRVVKCLKQFRKVSRKLVIKSCRKIFLLKCRELKVFPAFINFQANHIIQGLHRKRNKCIEVTNKFKASLLNLCIEDVHYDIIDLTHKVKNIIYKLESTLPAVVLMDFVKNTTNINARLRHVTRHRLDQKLAGLHSISCDEYAKMFGPFLQRKQCWLQNISSTILPSYVERVMCLGPMFALPYFKIGSDKNSNFKAVPLENIISQIEGKIRSEPSIIANKIREGICMAIHRYHREIQRQGYSEKIDIMSNRKFQCWLMMHFKEDLVNTMVFCRKNRQIKFIKADKSNTTVIIDADDYRVKMLDVLNDENTYKKVSRSLVPSQMEKNNSIVRTWFGEGFITENLYKHLAISGGNVAKIYGLVKLHKPDLPMRPIVSTVKTPFQKLSKFLAGILSNIVGKRDTHVKNSFEFFDFINGAPIPDGYKLISLDVISMYTNISVEFALECVESRWEEVDLFCPLPKEQFFITLKMCISTTIFQFEDVFYQQISGLAMGGSLSAVMANIVMEHIEGNALRLSPIEIRMYKRYVDDIFSCIREEDIQSVLGFFNNLNPSVKFTLEVENNGCLNYLDMSLLRVNGEIRCKWYQKPTASRRYANFLSVQPMHIKKNVAANLARRIIGLSHKSYRHEMIQVGRKILIENCYPHKFVEKIFRQVIGNVNRNVSQKVPQKEIKLEKAIPLPYVPFLSENISSILKLFGYQVVDCRYNTLEFLMSRLKAKTPVLQESGLVYKIPCSNCDVSYIGQTKQLLRKRVSQHRNDGGELTALKHHQRELGHQFNFNQVEILCREGKLFPRLVREMIEILKHGESVCNSRADVSGLSALYHQFFRNQM